MVDAVVVLITTPKGEGSRIARALVEKRLAACINVVHGLRSFYWWKGKIEDDEEELLVVKTKRGLLGELESVVKEIHPYTVPEIIALPIVWGSKDYMEWLAGEVKSAGSGEPGSD